MIKAYINAIDARFTIHNNPNCSSAQIKINQDQRTVLLNTDSLSRELRRFRKNEYRFMAEGGMNDIWLILDFQDGEFENALANYLQRLVDKGHKTSGNWDVRDHC
jgi:hypothetical protein